MADNKRPAENVELVNYKSMVAGIHEHLAAAMNEGPYMVVIFSSHDGVLHTHRHNHGIVEDDFELCEREFKRNLAGETGPPADAAPLPRANVLRPKPMDIMLGKAQEEPKD